MIHTGERIAQDKSAMSSFIVHRQLTLIVTLSIAMGLIGWAVDLNKNLLPDDWEAAHGFSTGAYAETNLIG